METLNPAFVGGPENGVTNQWIYNFKMIHEQMSDLTKTKTVLSLNQWCGSHKPCQESWSLLILKDCAEIR
jgi:hypothetical protein